MYTQKQPAQHKTTFPFKMSGKMLQLEALVYTPKQPARNESGKHIMNA